MFGWIGYLKLLKPFHLIGLRMIIIPKPPGRLPSSNIVALLTITVQDWIELLSGSALSFFFQIGLSVGFKKKLFKNQAHHDPSACGTLNGNGKFHSQILGTGTGIEKSIPNFWERERE